MRYGFGVDIFGNQTKIGFFDEAGNLLDKWKITTTSMNRSNQILPGIAEELEGYMKLNRLFEDDIIGIGVGIPGPVSGDGVVNKCVNFDWGVMNIDRALSGYTGLRVKSSNVTNLTALGECWKGTGSKNLLLVAMNTGLGGAIVCDGKLITGAHGGAGELGHMIVNREEIEHCSCGRRGCVEQYCSPAGILRLARRQLAATRTPSVLRNMRTFDYPAVIGAAASGDRVAKEVMNQFYDYVGLFLANACCATNPDTVVLGGEFCHIGPSAVDGATKAFHKYIFHANENVRFQLATLGTDATIYGGFKLVLDAFG